MDGGIAITCISVAMFVGCFILGFIPLLFSLSEKGLRFVTILGAGLLCGTALAIIIPEGVDLLEKSWGVSSCPAAPPSPNVAALPSSNVAAPPSSSTSAPVSPNASAPVSPNASAPVSPNASAPVSPNTSAPLGLNASQEVETPSDTGPPPRFFIGLALVVGFTFMFVVDQIGSYCSMHDPQTGLRSSTSITATLGLIIHAAADGFALGAAVATSEVTVQVIVFLAVILHKAPAAFGLVSFLMHAGVEKKHIQGHLLAFSAAAPILAITTYFILHASSSSHQNQFCMTGVGMLFSAGTFLYVATVHVLPEVSSRGQQHSPPLHTGAGAYQRGRLGVLESLTLVLGAGLPVLLALGLNDD
ncbi:zinc transporter ZIP9 isoform X1 [Centroberyx affinis]|uniref:zinc transporter ZIP9 isoform X1 n=1 Tax=Centroberyx affinis TaxID=166261 RepID=UPI003A5C3319